MAIEYSVYAVNLFDVIPIKNIRNALSGKVIGSSPLEMQVQYGEASYLFVFRFGCIVFFNMPQGDIDRELETLKRTVGPTLEFTTTDTYQVIVGDLATKVEFESVELKKLSLNHLRMIAMSLGQSAGLEYFEIKADRLLVDTASFMTNLAERGTVPFYSKKLFQVIGAAASTRQHIVTSLAILDPPDETWKSKELEKLYRDLQQNFDIDTRFKTLDRKLSLLQDNIEILADLVSNRRGHFLDFLIVLLIVLEVVLALFVHR